MSSWSQFYAQHDKHYTPVFNSFLESQIADPILNLLIRVLAWVLRNSWGRHSNDVIDADGIRQSQADCARALGLFDKYGEPDRRKINPVFKALERLNLLRFEGRDIFPIENPSTFALSTPHVGMGSDNYEEKAKLTVDQFLKQVWSASNPKAYEEYQTVERQYKQLRADLINDFKAYSQKSERGTTSEAKRPNGDRQDVGMGSDNLSGRGPTSGNASLYENPEHNNGRSSSSFSVVEEAHRIRKPTTTNLIEISLRNYGNPDTELTKKVLAKCQRAAPDCTEPEVVHFIHVKGDLARDARNPLGFLLEAVPKCFAGNYRARLPDSLLEGPILRKKRSLNGQDFATDEFVKRHLEDLKDAG